MPSQKVLEAIGWDEQAHRQYATFPGDTHELGLVSHFDHFYPQIRAFYWNTFKIDIDMEKDGEFLQKMGLTTWEALHNSQVHGSKAGTPFTHGLFLARKGICNGFYDEGGFFKREDVKHQFETRKPVTEFDLENKEGFRIGVNRYIFEFADLIEVDTLQGALYCAHYIPKR